MNVKKLFLLIVLIFIIGFGNNVIAGHRHYRGCGHNIVHRHYHGCGHSGWSFGFSVIITSPKKRVWVTEEYVETKKVWVDGCYEWQEQPSIQVYISDSGYWTQNGCNWIFISTSGHCEWQRSSPKKVWIPGYWTEINITKVRRYWAWR